MPAQTTKSALLAKLGDRFKKAAAATAAEEVDYGSFNELPAGINGGIAQLVDCKFMAIGPGKQNAGQMMFYAAAVVKSPVEHAGQHTEGLRTQISEVLFDTPTRGGRKTLEEHVKWVQNELKKLGARPEDVVADRIEATAEALRRTQPHLKFRTWKMNKEEIRQCPDKKFRLFVIGDDGTAALSKRTTGAWPTMEAAMKANPYAGREPMVQHQWNGLVHYEENGDATQGVTDHTGNGSLGEPPVDGEDDAPAATEAAAAETSGAAFDEFADLDGLVERAEADDQAARDELLRLATDAGKSEEEVAAAASWADVAAMIHGDGTAAEGGEEGEGEGEGEEPAAGEAPAEEPWEPKAEEVYDTYFPTVLDPKTKKLVKAKKPVEVEVLTVNKKARTFTLKDLNTGKTILDPKTKKAAQLSWDVLQQPSA